MPVLRLRRPEPSETAPTPESQTIEHPVDRAELEGFESETASELSAGSRAAGRFRPSWLTALLGALVLIEAVPTAMWVRDYFSPAGAVLPTRPSPTPALGSAFGAIAPCEPAVPTAPPPASVAPAAPAAAVTAAKAQPIAAGLLSVVAPLPLQVYSRGRLIGTSEAETLMLPLGSHELEFVNQDVGYRTSRSVTIQAGRNANLRIDPPTGTLHLNALPWAEVWVDDKRIGETPIGNMNVAIGTRQIVFRHPDLGERRTRVLVTLKEPARVSMDLRKP